MNYSNSNEKRAEPHVGKLGTFAGVFTPSVLTILGIILFMRLGFVVGNAGLGLTIVILLLANGISVLTSVSLSAIATNLRVKGGGDYYLISRTLGPEFGGSIGIVLFLAQSVSIAFYCIGFGEILAQTLGLETKLGPQIIAALAVAFLFIFAWMGADWATRFQFVVMTILAVALLSFFTGGFIRWDGILLSQNWKPLDDAPSFWVLFAIFFPAVTGFTQGVSMSGDLKDPGKSLPLGTFSAVGLSLAVYFLSAILFAAASPQEMLAGDYRAMEKIAMAGFLIIAGVVSATLSSAMASFLGAPRILQSLAGDRIIPVLNPFAKGYGTAGNPRRGVLLSTVIAFATIGLGNLNLIAPVVSMFFLISYGLLNYATYYEARSDSPSFRPRFRWYDARASLAGALACLVVMLAIDLPAGLIAAAVLFAIYQYIKRTAGPARWADSTRSYHLQQIRQHLLAASREPEHARSWRPQLLLFSDDADRRKQLLQFAGWIQGNSGFTTVVQLLRGQGARTAKLRQDAESEMKADIAASGLDAFSLVITTPDRYLAVQTLVQSNGIGPLHANTFLLNWVEHQTEDAPGLFAMLYGHEVQTAHRLGCNILVFHAQPNAVEALTTTDTPKRRIDCWWWGDATSRLMLLLAYLMTRGDVWGNAAIRLLAVSDERQPEMTLEDLKQVLNDVRIDAEPLIVSASDAESLVAQSAEADMSFVPFRLSRHQPLDMFGSPLQNVLSRLPLSVAVLAAEDIDLDAEPDEGKVGEVAAALDAVEDTRKRVQETEKEMVQAAKAVESLKAKLHRIQTDSGKGIDESVITTLIEDAAEAEEKLNRAYRRFAKARAKAENAAQEAASLGIQPEQNEKDNDE